MPLQLPSPLAPWAGLLDIFPSDLAFALGPLVQRLDVAIGPLAACYSAGQGEPDGYDGLSRRGIYDRLLVSEWLLAQEFPEEFLRRAANGEHAFLKLARREPTQARSCVALFDAGPAQLGAPRLAHLAVLLVLARRAASAEASFHWGILQQRGGSLYDEITPALIEAWLQARDVAEVTEESLAAWREGINSEIGLDDVWLVGGRRLERLAAARGASLLRVEDPLEPQAHFLKVRVVNARTAPQEVSLELPNDTHCTRLLRDPFGAVAKPWRRVSGACAARSNLIFAGAQRLLARGADDHMVLYPVPGSPRAGMGKPKQYPAAGGQLIGAGMFRKAVITVNKVEDSLRLHCVNNQKTPFPAGPYRFDELPPRLKSSLASSRLASLFFVESGTSTILLLWLPDSDGYLLQLDCETHKVVLHADHVSAAEVVLPGSLLFAQQNGERHKISTLQAPGKRHDEKHGLGTCCGFGLGGGADGRDWLSAVVYADRQWAIVDGDEPSAKLNPPSGTQVIGVVSCKDKWPTPGLVDISKDCRSISVWNRNWSHVLPRVPEPILHVSVCPTAPRIAYATAHEVAVYSLLHEAHLLRLRWEEL